MGDEWICQALFVDGPWDGDVKDVLPRQDKIFVKKHLSYYARAEYIIGCAKIILFVWRTG